MEKEHIEVFKHRGHDVRKISNEEVGFVSDSSISRCEVMWSEVRLQIGSRRCKVIRKAPGMLMIEQL